MQLIKNPWSAFLAYTLLRHGDESTQWIEVVNFIDELLWYIEPKINNEEKNQANNLRSVMNEKLKYGLSCIGLDANEIQQHLSSLEMCSQLATENIYDVQKSADTVEKKSNENSSQNTEQSILKNRPPNVTESHLQNPQRSSLEASYPKSVTQEKNETTIEKTFISATERASENAIANVLSMDFGTWLNWQKSDEPLRRLKLTWYNQKTQNCMLSNSMGQQVAIVSANEIALGMSKGSITVSDTRLQKPFFERMLETVVDRLRLKAQTA